MSLSIGNRIIADVNIQGATLRPVLGSYELVFGLHIRVHPPQDVACSASITGARVSVRSGGGELHACGIARPEGPFEIRQKDSRFTTTPELVLSLQPNQLAKIENLRGTGDLYFELLARGSGIDQYGEQQVQNTWTLPVARSNWIKKLGDAGARNILLIEVLMPFLQETEEWADITEPLKRAEEQFRNGDYLSCVAFCRTVIQELGSRKFKKKDWAGPLLSRLAKDRDGMTKAEREGALWGALRHYTHQAHHSGSDGGITVYSRAEAQRALILAASFVTHAQEV